MCSFCCFAALLTTEILETLGLNSRRNSTTITKKLLN